MKKNAFRSVRLIAETLLIIGAIEALIMLVLPVVAVGLSDTAAAVVDALALTLLAAPLLLWRFGRAAQLSDFRNSTGAPARPIYSSAWVWLVLLAGLLLSAGASYWVVRQVYREWMCWRPV